MKNAASEKPVYADIATAKTGAAVPLFADGKPANSLYNPEREAEKAAARFESETFAVFAGFADGRRAALFLAAAPENECIIIEKNSGAFSFLERLPDAASVMKNRRSRLFSLDDCLKEGKAHCGDLKALILQCYIPALFRRFSLDILPSWQARFPEDAKKIKREAEAALSIVSADFSAQAQFGKLWHLNAIKNLYNGAKDANLPSSNLKDFNLQGKKALVAAAGPSLDNAAAKIKEERASIALFAADTALPALAKRGIAADFVLSIDPQAVSARHFINGLPKGSSSTALIQDICASPLVAEIAWRQGCPVLFAAGGHPLSAFLASFSPLPRLETGAGTVTASAIDAAKKMGFKAVAMAGADFAYTAGKPYCRGTYLEEAFYSESSRLKPAEGMYTALMFRTPVTREADADGTITYKTELLERYKEAVAASPPPKSEWGGEIAASFPYKGFLFFYRDTLRSLGSKLLGSKLYIKEENLNDAPSLDALSESEKNALATLLPLASFFRRKSPDGKRKNILKSAFNLALNIAERYTRRL